MNIDIPGFIRHIRENDPLKALAKIKASNMFASICGRLCSAPCENACVFAEKGNPIGIKFLERYASDFGQRKIGRLPNSSSTGEKIAIVGSGPSGLAAAVELAQNRYQVTIFESLNWPGGVLRYGIPEFRMPKKVLDFEINFIRSLGIEIKTNFLIGRTLIVEELFPMGYSAILLATGAGSPRFLDIPGTNLCGVYYAEEILSRANLGKRDFFASPLVMGDKTIVIGDGYAALDCARLNVRLGKEVTVVFNHLEDDMSVRNEEKEHAKEEGVKLEPLMQPLEILTNGNHCVKGVKFCRMDFADPNSSGQWKIIPVPDSELVLEADSVIIATGHSPNTLISKVTPDLEAREDGKIWINQRNGMTSKTGVFACGDGITGVSSIVEAIADGKKKAQKIMEYLAK